MAYIKIKSIPFGILVYRFTTEAQFVCSGAKVSRKLKV